MARHFKLIIPLLFIQASLSAQPLRLKRLSELYGPDSVFTGKKAPDFFMYTRDGFEEQLSWFTGKGYVLINVWSTTLKNCALEQPFWDRLQFLFKDKHIAFLQLSVDKDADAWKAFVESPANQCDGLQSRTEALKPPFSYYILTRKIKNGKKYLSYTLPQFVLIDPKGTIVDSNLPIKPSDSTRFNAFIGSLPGI